MNTQNPELDSIRVLRGQRCRHLRALLGLSQSRLAALIEIGQTQWSSYEHAKHTPRGPTLRTIISVSRDLGWEVDPDWLLGLNERAPVQRVAQSAAAERGRTLPQPESLPTLARFESDDLSYGQGFAAELPLYEVCQSPRSYQFTCTLRERLTLPYPIWLDPGFYRLLWLSDATIASFLRRDMLLLCQAFVPERRDVGRALCLWEAGQSLIHFGFLQDDIHRDHWVLRPLPLGSTLHVIVWPRSGAYRLGQYSVIHQQWSRRKTDEFCTPVFPGR